MMSSTTDHIMAQNQASGLGRVRQGVLATGILTNWLSGFHVWMENRAKLRKWRDSYSSLLARDDYMLQDFGVTRLDLVHYLERLDGR